MTRRASSWQETWTSTWGASSPIQGEASLSTLVGYPVDRRGCLRPPSDSLSPCETGLPLTSSLLTGCTDGLSGRLTYFGSPLRGCGCDQSPALKVQDALAEAAGSETSSSTVTGWHLTRLGIWAWLPAGKLKLSLDLLGRLRWLVDSLHDRLLHINGGAVALPAVIRVVACWAGRRRLGICW